MNSEMVSSLDILRFYGLVVASIVSCVQGSLLDSQPCFKEQSRDLRIYHIWEMCLPDTTLVIMEAGLRYCRL